MVLNISRQLQIMLSKAPAAGEFEPPQKRAAHIAQIDGAEAKYAAIFAACCGGAHLYVVQAFGLDRIQSIIFEPLGAEGGS